MKLSELIISVRDKSLSKDQLEDYRDQMSELFAQMQMEAADLEKEEALFMDGKGDDETAISRKISWKATPSGQRLIVIKRYSLATKEMLNSLKSRLYTFL